jgi:tetratricopeptide (TPR) repeat protein
MRSIRIITALCACVLAANGWTTAATGAVLTEDFQKGQAAYARQDYWLAVHHFQLADRKQDHNANLHYYLANALTFVGKFDEAKQQYKKCMQLAPFSDAAKYAAMGLSGINTLETGRVNSTAAGGPIDPAQRAEEGRQVRQFIKSLNDQVADRQQLVRSEREEYSFAYTPSYGRHGGAWGSGFRHGHSSMPMYSGSSYSHRNDRNIGYYGGYSPYNSSMSSPYARQEIAFNPPRHRGGRYNSLSSWSSEKELAFEQAASGLESQMLNSGGGVKINPRGTNLYIRNYGSGVAPPYQPAPVIELLARQEKLVIDASAEQSLSQRNSLGGREKSDVAQNER